MKLIDKMLMECKPTADKLYMALVTVLENGTADMLCCFCDGYGKEVGREKKNYKDRHEAGRVLEELTQQYPDDEQPAVIICNVPRPAVIVDDVADVMQCAPA